MAQPLRMLLALILGLISGIALRSLPPPSEFPVANAAELIGSLWLDALKMTIIPLVLSLLITGIASGAQAARANRLALKSVLLFVILLWCSAAAGALLLPLFVSIWPLDPQSGAALSQATMGIALPERQIPTFAEFLRGVIPTNPITAAATDSLLPLIVFTTLFAVALTRLPDESQLPVNRFFAAVRDAMLVLIGWILWIGPLGVFALALVLGARAGSDAMEALVHYILTVSLVGVVIGVSAYFLATLVGRQRLGAFARAMVPPQTVAIGTQSSLASLPAMLTASERLGVPLASAGVVLPLAVTLFRATSPAMNVAVALYVAHWLQIELSSLQIATAVAVAATTTLGSVSLPGQISFFASIAPIAVVLNVPLEPIALLIAVETVPDIVRTLGNVSMDVAVTTVASRGDQAELRPAARQPSIETGSVSDG